MMPYAADTTYYHVFVDFELHCVVSAFDLNETENIDDSIGTAASVLCCVSMPSIVMLLLQIDAFIRAHIHESCADALTVHRQTTYGSMQMWV